MLELEPRHFVALLVYGTVLAELMKFEEAESAISSSYDLHPNPESLAMLGYVLALRAKDRQVEEVAYRVSTEYPAYPSINLDMARMLLAIGDPSGYQFLEKAVAERESDLVALNADPRWDRVRHEDRFMNLTQNSFASNRQ